MSGKSKEEIAFELVSKLKGVGVWGEQNQEAILDMYAQCLEATSGLRAVDNKAPTVTRLPESMAIMPAKTAKSTQGGGILPQPARAPHPAQNQVPPAFQQAPAQAQAAPVQTPAQQQQRVQQAYQQQQVQPR